MVSRAAVGLGLVLGLVACGGGGGGSGDDDDNPGDADGAGDGGDGDGDGAGPDASLVFTQVPLIEGLTTLAGYDYAAHQDGDRDHALFNNPVNVVVGSDGNLIVADFDNGLIRGVTPAGVVTTISEPPAAPNVFRRPFGLAVSGNSVYIQTDGTSVGTATEAGPGAIWRMPLEGGAPVPLRDLVGRCRGIAELPDGRVAMAFYQQHVVQLYDPVNDSVEDLAGFLNTGSFADGVGNAARFNSPYDVIVLADGSLLVSDFINDRLRQIDVTTGNVTTYAGTGVRGNDDGPREMATFNRPQGLAQDAAGNIYVTDTGSYRIRRIATDGQVTTIAGDGTAGYDDDADPLQGQLYGIEGADVGPDGYLYIADGSRGEAVPFNRVRRLTIP